VYIGKTVELNKEKLNLFLKLYLFSIINRPSDGESGSVCDIDNVNPGVTFGTLVDNILM
jgi:hypothetical protein